MFRHCGGEEGSKWMALEKAVWDALNLRDFWATEAALGFAMLAYNLMSLFCQAVLRSRIQHTLPPCSV